ncbi:MAG: hypothetical protein JNN15_17110 [Blastocatellia bacterium]|nr:hypothetical protein [Blastocatellia bacterium]
MLEIERQLDELPQEKSAVLYDFVTFLLEKRSKEEVDKMSSSYGKMLTAEDALKQHWEKEEDAVVRRCG